MTQDMLCPVVWYRVVSENSMRPVTQKNTCRTQNIWHAHSLETANRTSDTNEELLRVRICFFIALAVLIANNIFQGRIVCKRSPFWYERAERRCSIYHHQVHGVCHTREERLH